MKPLFNIVMVFAVTSMLFGCSTYTRLDRKVGRLVNRSAAGESGISSDTLADARARIENTEAFTNTVVLNAVTVLQLATKHGHALQAKRDTLYSSALSLMSARRDYGLQVAGTLQYIMGLSGDNNETDSGNADLTVSRKLLTGADISLAAGSSMSESAATTNSDETVTYSSSIRLRLNQPLLKGAGYTVSHEELVQAERNMVYALRDFTLERQDYAIELLQSYYSLLSQQTRLANIRKNVEQSIYLRKRSEALFKVRRAAAIDVLRSQQQELSAENSLSVAETDYDIAIKKFLITLGLPVEIEVNLEGSIPEVESIDLDEQMSVTYARENRLDLLTQQNRFDDVKRALWITKNNWLPDLSVYAEANYQSDSVEEFSDQELEEEISAGLSLELPFDRRDERDAIKRAQIALAATVRDLQQKGDSVEIEVVENFWRLGAIAKTVGIEEKNVDIAKKRARNAELKFKNGELSNRDVVEAENELLDARNAYVEAKIDHELQRLRLLRNIGLLDIAADGQLVELLSQPQQHAEQDKGTENEDE